MSKKLPKFKTRVTRRTPEGPTPRQKQRIMRIVHALRKAADEYEALVKDTERKQ